MVHLSRMAEELVLWNSQAFGFVDMESELDAQSALEGLDGALVDGRPITVDSVRERPHRTHYIGER